MSSSDGEKNHLSVSLCCVVQSLDHVWLFVTPWTAARQAFLSFTISWSLLKLMSIESVMPSNHLILCCPLLLLPSIFPSIRGFSNELALRIRWLQLQHQSLFPHFLSLWQFLSPKPKGQSLVTDHWSGAFTVVTQPNLCWESKPCFKTRKPRPPRWALSFTEMETEPRKDNKHKSSPFPTFSSPPRTLHSLQRQKWAVGLWGLPTSLPWGSGLHYFSKYLRKAHRVPGQGSNQAPQTGKSWFAGWAPRAPSAAPPLPHCGCSFHGDGRFLSLLLRADGNLGTGSGHTGWLISWKDNSGYRGEAEDAPGCSHLRVPCNAVVEDEKHACAGLCRVC